MNRCYDCEYSEYIVDGIYWCEEKEGFRKDQDSCVNHKKQEESGEIE